MMRGLIVKCAKCTLTFLVQYYFTKLLNIFVLYSVSFGRLTKSFHVAKNRVSSGCD